MFQKQKQLAIFNENTESLHVIENKTVIILVRGEGTKKCGGKNEGFSHYVIENKRRQIPDFSLAIMLMKRIDLEISQPYLKEK